MLVLFMIFSLYINQIMTATVETVAEQLDMAAIMPAEKVMPAVARSVTLTDADTGIDMKKRKKQIKNEDIFN